MEFAERSEATIPPGRVKNRTLLTFQKFAKTAGLAAVFTIAGFLLFQVYEVLAAPNLDQIHYRWRNDDANEANATWLADEDTSAKVPEDLIKRLRFQISNEGDTNSPSFTKLNSLVFETAESNLATSVVDPTNGFAYFGTGAGQIIKIRLSDFTKVGTLTLTEGGFASAVIDTTAGFAYFGTNTAPGKIVKIQLSDFTKVAVLTLADVSIERILVSAVIDTTNGFAYFGNLSTVGRIVKIRLSDFTRVGALDLPGGECDLESAVIDPANDFAYFSLRYTTCDIPSPSKIVKIRLSDFTRVGAITLGSGENYVRSAAIDITNGFAYFGTYTSSGKIVKVQLSDFTRVGAITLDTGEYALRSATIDSANGFAYFGTYTSPGKIVKIRLSDFTQVTPTLTLATGENLLTSAVIDTTNGFAYFGTYTSPGKIVKVQLSDFTRVGAITLSSNTENYFYSAVIYPTQDFAYFGTYTSPGKIVKVQLSDFTRVGAVTLDAGEEYLYSSVIDTTNGFAYFGTCTYPGKITKIQLSDFSRVGTITLETGEECPFSSVIDTTNGFAYFETETSPAKIIKIRLSDFTRVGAVTLDAGEEYLHSSVIDTTNGFAYFGTYTSPGKIVKVQLSDFTRVGALTLNTGEDSLQLAVVDTTSGFAYFGTYASPSVVAKIDTSPHPYTLQYGVKSTTCSAISSWTTVPVSATTEHWRLADSSYLTDAEATNNVASGLTDENTTFTAGEVKDTATTTSGISLATTEFTEVEYSLQATSNVTVNPYCFRLVHGLTQIDTYTTYAEASIVPTAPTIGAPTVLSSSSTRWNFTDNSNYETGFRVYDNSNILMASDATADINYIDETDLSENTQYSRHIKAYNGSGNSLASATSTIYTLADAPTNFIGSANANSINLTVDSFPNHTSGQSGYYFANTTNSTNSGWIQTNSWQDTGLSCGISYAYSVKYRNSDGTETSAVSLSQTTAGCGGIPQWFLELINRANQAKQDNDNKNKAEPSKPEAREAQSKIPDSKIDEFKVEAAAIFKADVDNIVSLVKKERDIDLEIDVINRYLTEIGAIAENKEEVATAYWQLMVLNFITYGTPSTQILGQGERAGVVNSYRQAFNKLPKTEDEWLDVIKISNGRWPSEKSEEAEERAKTNFKIVYLRDPDRNNSHDDAAITVMAYGLRPSKRNLKSEKAAIRIFKDIYGYNPEKSTAWDVVRAIAYSGATR